MSGVFSGSSSKSKESSSNQVTMPDWLRPFIEQSQATASGALGRLQSLTGQDNFADLTPDQLAALEGMRGIAGGAGGYLPTAQGIFMDAARGMGVDFLDNELLARLTGNFDLGETIQGARDAVGGGNDIATEALEAAARGDYLYGGQGFDEAVQAAVRAATPGIMSVFGGTAGGADSGLARTAVATAGIDAFASQYGDRMREKLNAARTLDSGSRADRQMFLGFGDSAANRAQRGDLTLAGLEENERRRQMDAARALPGIGMAGDELLFDVGSILQGQEQGEMDSRLRNTLQLLMSAMGGFNPSDYLGSQGNRRYRGTQFGFESPEGTDFLSMFGF